MERCVNLVATRVVDGDRRAALAWYADHVQQLLADPALEAAVLYERVDDAGGAREHGPATVAAPAPDMVCLYDFVTRGRFEAYESGPVRAAAAADRAAGWGREGIDIVWRALHWRVVRAAAGDLDTGPPAHCRLSAWRGAAAPASLRALAAGLHAGGARAWWLLRADSGDGGVAVHAPHDLRWPAVDGLSAAWHGRYARRLQWAR